MADVGLGTCRLVAEDDLLGGAPAAGDLDVGEQALLVVVEAVARGYSCCRSASPWHVEEALRDRSRDDQWKDDGDRITRVDGSGPFAERADAGRGTAPLSGAAARTLGRCQA
jgi:hypothetical protein